MRHLRICAAALLVIGALCFQACTRDSGQADDATERFLRLGWGDQVREIKTYPPARQIELLFLEHQRSEPSNSGLREAVAASGTALLPIVRQILEGQPTDAEKKDLLCVLMYMETLNYADVVDGSSLMPLAESEAERMDGDAGRDAATILSLMRIHAASDHSDRPPGEFWDGLLAANEGC